MSKELDKDKIFMQVFLADGVIQFTQEDDGIHAYSFDGSSVHLAHPFSFGAPVYRAEGSQQESS